MLRSRISGAQGFQNAINKQETNERIKRAANGQQTFNKRAINGTQFELNDTESPNGIQE